MIENSQPDGGYVLCARGARIPFRIEFRERQRLAITVHPDLRLEVIAPAKSNKNDVLARVEKRSNWILKQRRYFEQFLPVHPGAKFISGETHLYLGRQYRLKVRQRALAEVKLSGGFLQVWTPIREDALGVQSLLAAWYRQHAERTFARRLNILFENCPAIRSRNPPRLVLRRMTHRWGSCTKAGNILLNLDLVKAPTHCIDYVIVHELCHLQFHNHSPAFYRLLGRCLPDWHRRKRRLEECQLV